MIETGSTVTYLGHEATVIHVFTTTANIRLNKPVPGLSRQQDVMIGSLRLPEPKFETTWARCPVCGNHANIVTGIGICPVCDGE